MKKQFLFLSLSITLSIESFSQINFEKGYYINDSGQKIDCLIKNLDWKNNPSTFEFTLSQDAITQKQSIETVKEFGINGVSKYIRATVKIDKSSENPNDLSYERNPVFQKETLFLKVLVEGNASLYLYEKGSLRRFFFETNDSAINQLVYKPYLINNTIGQNNFYRQQIITDLKCQNITQEYVEKINYYKKDLEKLFVTYNECTNSEYINYELKQKADFINLTIRPGLNISNLEIKDSPSNLTVTDFGNKFSFRFGIETEFILPFNKGKWSAIVEPTYQYYNSKKTTESNNVSGGFLVSNVNYHSIELPIGVRYYFFLNNNTKIFTDISYILDFANNSDIKFQRLDGSILNKSDFLSKSNFSLGIGYKLNGKYSAAMKYQTNRMILEDYFYKTFSIIFGYTFF